MKSKSCTHIWLLLLVIIEHKGKFKYSLVREYVHIQYRVIIFQLGELLPSIKQWRSHSNMENYEMSNEYTVIQFC